MSEPVPTKEAARLLGVSRGTIQRWVREGKLVPHRRTLGGHARWDLERLEREVAELLGEGDDS